jgi:hypothetical protein
MILKEAEESLVETRHLHYFHSAIPGTREIPVDVPVFHIERLQRSCRDDTNRCCSAAIAGGPGTSTTRRATTSKPCSPATAGGFSEMSTAEQA